MKVGIMQPYFFPYLGYFSLIKAVDKFILLEDVQFIRHGWIERNRVLKSSGGWQYISVPLKKHGQKTLIKDIRISYDTEWKKRIISQLSYYKRAPYFKDVMGVINNLFEENYNSITEQNNMALKTVLNYLNINTPIEIFDSSKTLLEPVLQADEWALNICKAIGGVEEYWNPPGGISFFNKDKYEKENIKLRFHSVIIEPYNQYDTTFEEALSILDVMMFNSPEKINKMLERYTVK